MRKRRMTARAIESISDQQNDEGDYMPREFADWREIPSESLERRYSRGSGRGLWEHIYLSATKPSTREEMKSL